MVTIEGHQGRGVDQRLVWLAGVGGIATGYLTPLMEYALDHLAVGGRYGFIVAGLPFTILVIALIRILRRPGLWLQGAVAVVTSAAFFAAIRVTGLIVDARWPPSEALRNAAGGLAGGFTGAAVMAAGFCVLRLGHREFRPWLPMLIAGTLAGLLLQADLALRLNGLSLLFTVWQASVAAALVMALRA